MKTNGATQLDEDQGRAVTLWRKHPDSTPLDPQVWWWKGMTKAIEMLPINTNAYVEKAVIRLANAYWRYGSLPDDPVECKHFTGLDARTMKKYWPQIRLALVTYFGGISEDRRERVKDRIAKEEAGRAGGRAETHMRCVHDAYVQAGFTPVQHFSEAEKEKELEGLQERVNGHRSKRTEYPEGWSRELQYVPRGEGKRR